MANNDLCVKRGAIGTFGLSFLQQKRVLLFTSDVTPAPQFRLWSKV